MKLTRLTLLMLLVIGTVPAQAEHDHSSSPSVKDNPDAMIAEETPSIESNPTNIGMAHLNELMTQIESTDDPEERQVLLHDHMQGMLEQIKLMRKPAKAMKMGMMKRKESQASENMMCSKSKKDSAVLDNKASGSMMQRGGMMGMHKEMQNKVERIEQLLEQMIRHSRARETPAP